MLKCPALPIKYSDLTKKEVTVNLTIDSDYRRNGFAKALLGLLEVKLQEKNIEKIFLEVRESNLPAKNLYSTCGYKEISKRKKYYSDGEDAVIMAKEL